MKASDLRLGNKVFRNNIIVTVDEQTFSDLKNFPEQYKPIRLTEEWLLKLGFNKSENSNYYIGIGEFDEFLNVDNNLSTTFLDNNYTDQVRQFEKETKYIHQLQNLFFALCGEELELK